MPAICSFALGMAGQIAYHLLAQAGAARAPWAVTTMSCLPVLVLAVGTALADKLGGDAAADATGSGTVDPTTPPARCPISPGPDRIKPGPGADLADRGGQRDKLRSGALIIIVDQK
jgi:hypothetical protein